MVKVNPKTQKTSFKATLPEADSVALVGDFNLWNSEANPMKKGRGGVWKAELALKAGEYQFRYFVNEIDWVNDEDAPVVPNAFGSYNSVAVVQFPAPKAAAKKTASAKVSKGKRAKK